MIMGIRIGRLKRDNNMSGRPPIADAVAADDIAVARGK